MLVHQVLLVQELILVHNPVKQFEGACGILAGEALAIDLGLIDAFNSMSTTGLFTSPVLAKP